MNARPLSVLAVTSDRAFLRHLSRFLTGFGYEVRQAADVNQALAAIEAEAPDFLLLDSDKQTLRRLQQCGVVSSADGRRRTYTILLRGRCQAADVVEALEAGVDDILSRPLVYGEALGRLRAGARMLEFERRLREQSAVNLATRLMSRSALLAHMRAALRQSPRVVSCVTLDLDYFRRVNEQYGRAAGDAALTEVAAKLAELCADQVDALACFGADRFAAALVGKTSEEAARWADTLRAELAGCEFPVENTVLRFTASFGVADSREAMGDPEAILMRAATALRQAKGSGRDCVVRDGELDRETSAWTDLAAPGRLFEGTAARDIMTPCVLALRAEDSLQQASDLLRQTGLDLAPVIDVSGRLIGAIWKDRVQDVLSGSGAASQRVKDVMNAKPPAFEESASFADLLEHFALTESLAVLIVDQGRPTGMVTCDGLSSLGAPLARDTFAPHGRSSDTSEYLLVTEGA